MGENDQLSFETTPSYFSDPNVPKRVFETNPDMKLIITLCDPVLRTLNHIRRSWLVSKNWPLKTKLNHFETFEFTSNFPSNLLAIILHEMDADDDPHPSSIEGEPCEPCSGNIQKLQNYLHKAKDEKPASFLTRSFYSIHINRWLEYFNEEQIYLTTSQSILTNTSQVLSDIEDFLGVESYDLSLHRSQLKANEGYKSLALKGTHTVPLLYEWFHVEEGISKIKLPYYYEEANFTYVESVKEIHDLEEMQTESPVL